MKNNLTHLPLLPGVYLFKNKRGSIIYVGKAKSLRKRVSSYFQKQSTDWKVSALLTETESIDYLLTKNEIEALLLEADLVKKYQPKFNVLLKSGQPFLYITVTTSALPELKIVRTKKDKGRFFGPFIHKQQVRKMYDYLITTFKLYACNKKIENGCLDYHLGKCAGTCMSTFDKAEYLVRLELATNALEQNKTAFLQRINQEIARQNSLLAFEKAKQLHDYAQTVDTIFTTLKIKFNPEKYAHDILIKEIPDELENYEETAVEIQKIFDLPNLPYTIDCFDISHFQSSFIVGSCVRFNRGMPDKNAFRKFKIKTLTIQNDYAALHEIVKRRYKDPADLPDLVLIDGGKGQRSAVLSLLGSTPCLSLAKREEIIFSDNYPEGYPLHLITATGRLLIRLRNYAHHFALHYHRTLRSKGNDEY